MIDTIIMAVGILFMTSMAAQGILFYYLEASNNYDDWPFLKINFGLLSFYDKKVKEKDEFVKRVRNFLLSLAGYSGLFAIILCIIIVLFNLK